MATNYPGGMDSLPRPTSTTLMDDPGFEGDVVIDNISDAIEAIQGELGVNPSGVESTVAARLGKLGVFIQAAQPTGGDTPSTPRLWWDSDATPTGAGGGSSVGGDLYLFNNYA